MVRTEKRGRSGMNARRTDDLYLYLAVKLTAMTGDDDDDDGMNRAEL